MIKREYLKNYFSKENEIFSFEDFFTDDAKDKRAIIVITPNEIIKTKNIIDNNKEMSGHDITYDFLTKTLYNIMFDKNGIMSFDEQEIDANKDAISYLQYYQNIMIRMCNEGVNHTKFIWIHIPPKITTTQLELLEYLNNETKDLFKDISTSINHDNGDYLVAYNNYLDKTVRGDTLDIAIDYIKNNNMINDTDPVIDEDCIIGNKLYYKSMKVTK